MSEDRVQQFLGEYLTRYSVGLTRLLAVCESPIERLFLAAALGRQAAATEVVPEDLRDALGVDRVAFDSPIPTMGDHTTDVQDWQHSGRLIEFSPHIAYMGDTYSWLVPQFELDAGGRAMRIDFALFPLHDSRCPPVSIELDGHDFHERTKEQAERDKSRDRILQASGWQVLRFTGSEVWRDPARCVREMHLVMFWEHLRREPALAEIVRRQQSPILPRGLL